MQKIIWPLIIMQLIVVTVEQNLILHGDFQGLVSIGINRNWEYCELACNGFWSASNGLGIQIHRINVGYFNSSSINTFAVDMKNSQYFQLCQNVYSMEEDKIYQFTFDMKCLPMHNNCSIWIILNGQVVNGTNYTSIGSKSGTMVGFLKSTMSDNRICFDSRVYPDLSSTGPIIDNITLKLFTDSIPCNVPGCQLCQLNFPDICSKCLSDRAIQPNKTCTACAKVISNCIRCSTSNISNQQYTCLQCARQFQLNNQTSICFRKLFFSFEIQESASIDNSFKIKTNLSISLLTQAGFNALNLPQITVKINGQIQQSLNITVNENGFLEVKVNLVHQFKNFQITFEIEQSFLAINNTFFSIRNLITGRPSTVFYSETQISIFLEYDELAQPILKTLDTSFSILKSSGFGFLIANIFNYVNLMTIYAYLNAHQPKSFKLFIQKLSEQLNSLSFYKLINLQDKVNEIGSYQVTEKIEPSKTQWSGPLQAGYSTNFYRNNIQSFTFIVSFIVRLILCWVLHKVFKVSYFNVSNAYRFISICSQFQSMIPIMILPLFNLIIKQIASINYVERINTFCHLMVLFVCLLIPFIHLIIESQQVQRQIQKDRKKLLLQIKQYNKTAKFENFQIQIKCFQACNQQSFKAFNQRTKKLNIKRKNGLAQAKYKLFQRLMLLSIPIFVVFTQVLPFLLLNLCILLIVFALSLKLRKGVSTYQFLLNAFISLIWVLYHCTFCVYFVIQKFFLGQESLNRAEEILKYTGYVSVIIILVGAILQIVDCLLGIFLFVKQIVLYIYENCKNMKKIAPQTKKSSQKKDKNSNQPTIGKAFEQILKKFSKQNKNEYKIRTLTRFNINQLLKSKNLQVQTIAQSNCEQNCKNNNTTGRRIKKAKDQIRKNQLMVKLKHQEIY